MTGAGTDRPIVGVNLTWLVPGVVGGSEEYTIGLLRAYHELGDERIDLVLYCRRDLLEAYPDLADRFECVTMPPVGIGPFRPRLDGLLAKAGRVLLEQTWLARASASADLIHHAGGVVPVAPSRPSVVTIFDLQPLDLPENFSPIKRRWLGQMLPRAARTARLVLTISEFTAARLAGLGPDVGPKTRLISPIFESGLEPGACALPGIGKTEPALGGRRILLYPAITYRHKRHRDLIDAFHQLTMSPGDDFDDLVVVFTGRPGPEAENVQAQIDQLGLADRVHWLGRVDREVLTGLYRTASVLVFPSGYEGFGIPCLEAMSLGCPVVASDAGALGEVVGDAGLVYPVGDVATLAADLARILTDEDLAADLTARGRIRAADFTAKVAAEALRTAYHQALGLPEPVAPNQTHL